MLMLHPCPPALLPTALSADRPAGALLVLTRSDLAGMTILFAAVLPVAVAVLLGATGIVILHWGWFD